LANCINVFLVQTREKVAKIDDEEFETIKGAVKTNIAEKDIKLSYESSRFWGEIATHKYNFKRQ
jgi:secreted Zn-dependent insulinase-like peptidase